MKSIIKLSIALLFILSQATFAQSCITYPLNLGDIWQYEILDLNEYFSVEVIGDTTFLSNGYTYKILQNNFGIKGYKRIYEDKVYYYNNYLQSDQIRYDFTLQPGDTVAVFTSENDTTIITLIDIRYANIFGLVRKQWLFLYDTVPYLDDEVVFTITDSIGLTSAENIFVHQVLVGAIINGTTYGNIVIVEDEQLIPTEIALEQNYPNPFNPSTTIKFSLPSSGYATLKIYNALGEEVAELLDKKLTNGTYQVEWNASNVPSGVYFYQLKTGSFVQTKKMILMK